MRTHSVFVFSALVCEAKPLIQDWNLKKIPGNHPFSIYADDARVIVISGVGKIAMAAALGYGLSLFPDRQYPILINLGIAGHRQYNLGSLFLADKIIDMDSGKKFYPQLAFKVPCKTSSVLTESKPQTAYSMDCLYDMEAAAFYEISSKFSSSELIHSLKIVSDNEQSPLEKINEDLVRTWITAHLQTINTLILQLRELRNLLSENDYSQYHFRTTQFHFTASTCVKLKSLLHRWQLLNNNNDQNWLDVEAKNGKAIIAKLEALLEKKEFYL